MEEERTWNLETDVGCGLLLKVNLSVTSLVPVLILLFVAVTMS